MDDMDGMDMNRDPQPERPAPRSRTPDPKIPVDGMDDMDGMDMNRDPQPERPNPKP
jgi:hypothetical protein